MLKDRPAELDTFPSSPPHIPPPYHLPAVNLHATRAVRCTQSPIQDLLIFYCPLMRQIKLLCHHNVHWLQGPLPLLFLQFYSHHFTVPLLLSYLQVSIVSTAAMFTFSCHSCWPCHTCTPESTLPSLSWTTWLWDQPLYSLTQGWLRSCITPGGVRSAQALGLEWPSCPCFPCTHPLCLTPEQAPLLACACCSCSSVVLVRVNCKYLENAIKATLLPHWKIRWVLVGKWTTLHPPKRVQGVKGDT